MEQDKWPRAGATPVSSISSSLGIGAACVLEGTFGCGVHHHGLMFKLQNFFATLAIVRSKVRF
jgi:hypothetical protein